jgi:hypothetical protein
MLSATSDATRAAGGGNMFNELFVNYYSDTIHALLPERATLTDFSTMPDNVK